MAMIIFGLVCKGHKMAVGDAETVKLYSTRFIIKHIFGLCIHTIHPRACI
jgi:hypothetical protein